MSYKSHRLAPGRVFDHLYDPLYTTSGYKDVWRHNQIALTASAPINIYPVYKTMFTDLPRRQRNYYVMLRNPLPHFPPISRAHDVPKRCIPVTGADRAKFFQNPKTDTKTISLKLDLGTSVVQTDCRCKSTHKSVVSPCRAIGCQTMYRETSAQTKPWMPDAIIGSKRPDTPEVVYVAELLHADVNGTEPGVHETEIVERARKRRQWEKSLPAISTYVDWHKRRIVLEAFEWEEWVAREHEFEYCQKFRLGLVQKMMEHRDEQNGADAISRLENTSQQLQQATDNKLKALRTKHQRHVRRLQMERNATSKKYRPVNVATEHIDHGSNLYGPQMRFGVHPKHSHFIAYKTNFEARLERLHAMQTKPTNIQRFIEPREDITKAKGPLKEVKQGLWTDKYLQYLYESLRTLRFKKAVNHELAECLKYIKQSSDMQLTTPNESTVSISFEEELQTALVMQKLIKGRAVQLSVCHGLNKYQELIAELQSTHQLEAVSELNASETSANPMGNVLVHDQMSCFDSLLKAKAQLDESMDQAKGTTMEFMLEFLEKELERMTQQKKAHAMCMLAENRRFQRESHEAGLRQCADERRRENQTIFQMVDDSKQRIATEFLENVLLDGFETMAEHDARERIRAIVRNVDEQSEQHVSSDSIVSGELNRYILPDIMERIARDSYAADVQASIFGEPIADRSNVLLNKFIESVLTPLSLQSSPSVRSSLNDTEESADEESVQQHSIREAIQRSCDGMPNVSATIVNDIVDDVINNILPVMDAAITTRSQESDNLQDILTDVNETIWSYVNEAQMSSPNRSQSANTNIENEEINTDRSDD